MKTLNTIVGFFGFDSFMEFSQSFISIKYLILTIPISLIMGGVETWFGLKVATLGAFIFLLTIELISGIWASLIKGKKISSHRFSRFGMKLFLWLAFFLILNTLKRQQPDTSIAHFLYSWLFSMTMVYVCLEYLVSVIENIGVISGKSKLPLINKIIKKIKNLIN